MRRDLTHIAVRERHEITTEGHHLAAVLDMEIVQARLGERVGEWRRGRAHGLALGVSGANRARVELSHTEAANRRRWS